MERQMMTVLSPQPRPLPRTRLLLSEIQYMDSHWLSYYERRINLTTLSFLFLMLCIVCSVGCLDCSISNTLTCIQFSIVQTAPFIKQLNNKPHNGTYFEISLFWPNEKVRGFKSLPLNYSNWINANEWNNWAIQSRKKRKKTIIPNEKGLLRSIWKLLSQRKDNTHQLKPNVDWKFVTYCSKYLVNQETGAVYWIRSAKYT